MAPSYPARIGSHYVLGVIGSGRLGTVYRAYDEAQASVVALRVLSSALLDDAPRLERFRNESQALAALSHPNIVRVLTFGKDGELCYVVMEYVDGGSLVDRLRSARPALAECGRIIREVACGLDAAYASGIIHGALTPRKILASRDLSVVKIGDFGTEVEGVGAPSEGTTSGLLGGLQYRAPEVLLRESSADSRSDIYSLGVIAYELLTGRIPVGKFKLPSAVNSQVPLGLDPVILRCLSSDPAQRYQSANDFLADLDKVREVADYQVISELKQLTGRRGTKSATDLFIEKRSRRPLYLGLAVLFLALLAGAAVMLRPFGDPTASTAVTSQKTSPTPSVPSAPARSGAPLVVPTAVPPTTTPVARATTSPPPVPPTTVPAPVTVAASGKATRPAPVSAPDLEAAAAALFSEAQALVNKDNDGARKRFATIAASYSQSSWFVPAMTAKINLEDRGRLREFDAVAGVQVPASLLTRRLLAERAPKHPSSEAALWWLGEAYDDLHLYQLAAEAFSQLGARFPNTRYDAWFKAGELYERRLNNKAEARAAYLKVPSVSRHYKDAQNRSQRIGR
jgi:serine/threonine protein kinase